MSRRQARYVDKRKREGWREVRVWLSPDLCRQLDAELKLASINRSELVRTILAEYFDRKKQQMWKHFKKGLGMKILPRKKGIFSKN